MQARRPESRGPSKGDLAPANDGPKAPGSPLGTLLGSSLEIPTVPSIAAQVMRATEAQDLSATRLARLIQTDQGITARLIKTANSSLYGLTHPVTSLSAAIAFLGFAQVRDLVLASSTRHLYKRFGPLEQRMWLHSVVAAVATRLIASELAPAAVETAYLAGQMHDIGQVVMNNAHPSRFAEALANATARGACQAERAAFGFSHADVGALLASKWRMPAAVEMACFYHHDTNLARSMAPELGPLVACVVLANVAAHRLGFAHEANLALFEPDEHDALELLGASTADFDGLVSVVETAVQEQGGI